MEGNAISTIPKPLCNRPSWCKIYLAKTHIDETYSKNLKSNCTAQIKFDLLIPINHQNFEIIDPNDNVFYNNYWFYLFMASQLVCFMLAAYIGYNCYKHRDWQNLQS